MKTTHVRLTGWIILACQMIALGGEPGEGSPGAELKELESFVVTATRTERLVTEAPVKTELILPKEMSAYNVTSFRDALKLIPTMRFESDCQNCGVNQIQLMGLSTEYTSILFDGAPLYSGLAKVYGADLFPAIFIDRIEVVKGGSSVLYGPEAMAGVVNLLTLEPLYSGLEAAVGAASILGDATEWEGTFQGDSVDADGRHSISVYGLWQDREGLDLTTDGFTEIPEFENRVAGFQSWWHPVAGATLKIGLQFMDQAHRGGDRLDLPEEQARVAESLQHEIVLAQAGWDRRVNPHFDYQLNASVISIERLSFYGARGDSEQRAFEEAGFTGEVTPEFVATHQDAIDAAARRVWGRTDNHVLFLDGQVNHEWRRHILSYGIQYRFEDLEDGSLHETADTPQTKDSFSNAGVFIQDQWFLSDRWELVPGLRLDHHDNVEDFILSPRLAARYARSENLTFRASWSTGFNAPGAFNEDKHIGVNNGGAIFLVNEPDLNEERSHTLSVGAEYRPNVFAGRLFLHSQVHHTLLQDTFEIDDSGELSGDPNLWLRINGPDAIVDVWENNLNWQISSRLRLDVGLSWIDARFEEPIERVTGLVTDQFIKRPKWTGHAGLSYENHDFFDANLFYTYTGSMLATGEDADIWRETDSFHVFDLGISREFEGFLGADRFTVSAGIDNLFDERQQDQQNNGEERDPTYLYGPVTPRTTYLRLSATW